MRRKVSLNTYTPAKILPTPPATLKSTKANSKPGQGYIYVSDSAQQLQE
jgi:inositol hexakisphosphate/diphosphoinositol-pentakisphosphate kinase